jgi:23S rRNA (pseudouridine1915-N3)-methyltransferase
LIYKIACVGRIKEDYFTELIDRYRREIDKRDKLVICEVPDERIPQKSGEKVNSMIIHAEAVRLKNVISRDDYVIVLCIEGRKTATEELKSRIERVKQQGYGTVTFVIGGSLGLDPDIIRMADYKFSVSEMTFPHQLMRVALAEQLQIISSEM